MAIPPSTAGRSARQQAGSLWARVDRARDLALALLVFLPLLILYVATGNIDPVMQSPDAVAAALPAWHLAAFHTLHLDNVVAVNPWLLMVNHHVVSNRQPGVIFFAVPFFELLGHSKSTSNLFPAIVAAATAAAGAVTFLVLSLRRLLGTPVALVAGVVLALGTATWSVSADTLWPHGPDQLFLAAAMYFLSRSRWLPASIAMAAAVPVREHLAVVALVAGVWLAIRHRSAWRLVAFGVPSAAGIGLVVLYNHWTYGAWSIGGGYDSYVTANLTAAGPATGHFGFPTNVLGALFSPQRGLVVWCPLLVVLGFALRSGWRQAPDWVRISACGGMAYLLIQLKMNYFSGGDRFWSYRLTIETLTLCTPLLACCGAGLWRRRPGFRRWLLAAAIYGIGTQAAGAIFFKPDTIARDAWTDYKLAHLLATGGTGPRVVIGLTVIAMVVALLVRRPAGRTGATSAEAADLAPLALAR